MTELVWYAGYGSNLCRERFACYLSGGTPSGSRHLHAGCRDRSPARLSAPLRIRGRLTFAGESPIWGGGLAFPDADDTDSETVARGYLLTRDQLDDVAAQEPRYDRITTVGSLDEGPVVALTSSRRYPVAAPSAPYLRTVLSGLTDEILDTDQAVTYLLGTQGVDLVWDETSMRALVEQRPAARG